MYLAHVMRSALPSVARDNEMFNSWRIAEPVGRSPAHRKRQHPC
jgi:hypothetical protein